jgi:hypothetical protein
MTTRTTEQDNALANLIGTLKRVKGKHDGGQHNQDYWLDYRDGVFKDHTYADRLKLAEEGKIFEFGSDNICDTTGCAAGWATVNAGFAFRWVAKKYGSEQDGDLGAFFDMEYKRPGSDVWQDGYFDFVYEAADILGLTTPQAIDVFHTYTEDSAIEKLESILDGTWEDPEGVDTW